MKRILENMVILFVVILIVLSSILLISYNEYNVSQIGNKTFLVIDNDMLNYKKGSLLVVESIDINIVEVGDYVFYYDISYLPVKTVLSEVAEVIELDKKKALILNDGSIIDEKYLIGDTKGTKEYARVGSIISVLLSKQGNFIFIVIPSIILFIYELYDVIHEFINTKKNKKRIDNS